MYLPNKENALIEESKLLKYLLNFEHPEGRHKARFFESCGYTLSNAPELSKSLKKLLMENEVTTEVQSPFGVKYLIDGFLETLTGTKPLLRSVWLIKNNEKIPQLITAYPLKDK